MNTTSVTHTEPAANAPAVQNPAADAFNIIVSVPDQITIKMVNASVLGDYEYHLYVASLFLAATVGFLIPTIQEFRGGTSLAIPFLFMTIILGLAFIVSYTKARMKRSDLVAGGKEIKLKTTGAVMAS